MSVWVLKSERTSACKKYYIWYPAICSCKNGKYLAFFWRFVFTYDKIIEEKKNILRKTVLAKSTSTNFYI